MYHSFDKRVWLLFMFLPPKESLTLFQMDFFCYTFTYFIRFGVIKNRVSKINYRYFHGNSDQFIPPGWSILFLYAPAYKAWLFEKFTFDLDTSSYRFKITCILLRQVIPLKKMVVSSAKFTILILWSPICIPLFLLLA